MTAVEFIRRVRAIESPLTPQIVHLIEHRQALTPLLAALRHAASPTELS